MSVIQEQLSTVKFPEALLCFPYALCDSTHVDEWLFFHVGHSLSSCAFISEGFGVHILCLNDDFDVFNCPQGAGSLCSVHVAVVGCSVHYLFHKGHSHA